MQWAKIYGAIKVDIRQDLRPTLSHQDKHTDPDKMLEECAGSGGPRNR